MSDLKEKLNPMITLCLAKHNVIYVQPVIMCSCGAETLDAAGSCNYATAHNIGTITGREAIP